MPLTTAVAAAASVPSSSDPIGMAPQLSLRYGLYEHLDVGYRDALGATSLMGAYSFWAAPAVMR